MNNALSRKICLAVTGAALIALGIFCICRPGATIVSIATIIGVLVLVSGIATLFYWAGVRAFFPQSGATFLSGVLQVVLGILFLNNKFIVAEALPIIFAFWMLMEGINLAVRALDYKKVGFGLWWLQLAFGIAAAVLGFASLRAPLSTGGSTLSVLIGIGLILMGMTYLVGLAGVSRFQRRLSSNPWIDEQ